MRNFPLKKIFWAIFGVISLYHIIFGGWNILSNIRYPFFYVDNSIVGFGNQLRTGILYKGESKSSDVWYMKDIQPERQLHPEHGFIGTRLDENVYAYEVKMGWFYQYKTFYVYGRNGFWIIQVDPFHITLLRNPNIPEKDARALDETIAKYKPYGDQFTVIHSDSDLTKQERKEYAKLKEKAQPRIEELKQQGYIRNGDDFR